MILVGLSKVDTMNKAGHRACLFFCPISEIHEL